MKKSSRRRYVRFHIGSPRRIFFSFLYTPSYPFLIYSAKVERTRFYEKKDFVFLIDRVTSINVKLMEI